MKTKEHANLALAMTHPILGKLGKLSTLSFKMQVFTIKSSFHKCHINIGQINLSINYFLVKQNDNQKVTYLYEYKSICMSLKSFEGHYFRLKTLSLFELKILIKLLKLWILFQKNLLCNRLIDFVLANIQTSSYGLDFFFIKHSLYHQRNRIRKSANINGERDRHGTG